MNRSCKVGASFDRIKDLEDLRAGRHLPSFGDSVLWLGLDSFDLGEHVLIFGDGDDEQRASRHLFAGIANPQTSAK